MRVEPVIFDVINFIFETSVINTLRGIARRLVGKLHLALQEQAAMCETLQAADWTVLAANCILHHVANTLRTSNE